MSGEAQQLEHECKLSFSYSARLSGQMMSLSKDALHTHCVPYTKTIHSHSLALSHTLPPRPAHTILQLKEKGKSDEMCDFECNAGSLPHCPPWSALFAVVAVTLSLLCA